MILRRETLTAALAATTADDTRYFLNAIQAEPANHRVVATNGHILLIATDRSPYDDADFPQVPGAEFHGSPAKPVLIDADICKAMIATMPKRSSIPILAAAQLSCNGSPSTFTVAATDLKSPRVATIETVNGQNFPQYERLITERPTVRLVLAVPVLEAMIKAAKAVVTDKGKLPTITLDVPSSAPEVTTAVSLTITGSDVTVTGLAMPCRS